MLEIQGLEVSYGHFQVLWGIDLEVREGQVVCVLGPNGAGKSTIMNAVTGLVARQGGRVLLSGEDLAAVPTHAMAERGLI
ncbi:MAG: ATP-binding cassette domain-containing protein, partial [Rhodospirillales bacterium]|nr:ATP-binding cassette domain-containing protein [Rhodospirillales bacterium]